MSDELSRNIPNGSRSRKIASVAVIGAGVMGRGIAAANIENGIAVTLADIDAQSVRAGIDAILFDAPNGISLPPRGPAASSAERGGPGWGGDSAPASIAPIRACTSDDELLSADLVIETVTERLSVKQQVLTRLEPLLRRDVLLASNTSGISITKIARALTHPERFCGLHFCHPVRHRPLVEVVPGEKTSDQTTAAAVEYVRSLGKLPIVVKDMPGFLVNRLLTPYLNEAIELILAGASIEMVEACAQDFGMPLGPLRQFDEYGIDVAVRTGAMLYAAYPDRIVASELPIALYKAGRLGRKTGAGFFTYATQQPFNSDDAGLIDGDARRLIDERRRTRRWFSPREITLRLFLPMLLEATRALDEQVVGDTAAIDAALHGGLGFASPHGGLLRWADALGAETIVKLLVPFSALGKRYKPTPMLLRLAAAGRSFYETLSRPLHLAVSKTRAA